MNKKLLWTLLVIGLTAIVLLLNMGGTARIDLYFGDPLAMRPAFAYLSFTAVGVLIGILLK
ncbi:MAG: hypothetical protein FJ221_18560 [Lentisphaerae bacterium]|nr:hypothetical protein [Lentisphaerota bacterium]